MRRIDLFFKIGLLLMAVVLPFSIAATNIVFFTMVALWVSSGPSVWKRWPLHWGRVEQIFVVFLAVSLLSVLFGLDWRNSMWRMRKDLNFFVFPLIISLIADASQARRLIRIFVLATFLTAVLGWIQWFSGVHLTEPSGFLRYIALVNDRALGTRSHPIRYSECLLIGMAWIMAWIVFSRRKLPWRALAALIVMGGALVASQTRGSWIAAGIMILALAIWPAAGARYRWRAIFLLLPVIFIISVPHFRARVETISNLKFESNSERLHMWRVGWHLFKQKPLLGIGPGNVKNASFPYLMPEEAKGGGWGHLHNLYVNIAVERGAAGLAAFLCFMWALARPLLKGNPPAEEYGPWLAGGFLACLAFLLTGFTEFVYGNMDVLISFYFVMALCHVIVEKPLPSGPEKNAAINLY
jgi:O-antigen ligase